MMILVPRAAQDDEDEDQEYDDVEEVSNRAWQGSRLVGWLRCTLWLCQQFAMENDHRNSGCTQ